MTVLGSVEPPVIQAVRWELRATLQPDVRSGEQLQCIRVHVEPGVKGVSIRIDSDQDPLPRRTPAQR